MLNTEFCIDLLEINIKVENDIYNHNICVVGAGNWGRNHIRTLHQLNSLGAVVENDPQAIRFIKEEYPYCNIHTDLISSLNIYTATSVRWFLMLERPMFFGLFTDRDGGLKA